MYLQTLPACRVWCGLDGVALKSKIQQALSCSVAPIIFPFIFGGCPAKMVFVKKGSLFQGHGTTEGCFS